MKTWDGLDWYTTGVVAFAVSFGVASAAWIITHGGW